MQCRKKGMLRRRPLLDAGENIGGEYGKEKPVSIVSHDAIDFKTSGCPDWILDRRIKGKDVRPAGGFGISRNKRGGGQRASRARGEARRQ